MTTTLKTILEHVDTIKTACDTFGFQEPQLHRYHDTDYLCLSVQMADKTHARLSEMSERIRLSLLAFYLTEYFQCNVVVYSEAELGNQKEQLGKRIDLNADRDKVAHLFSVSDLTKKTFEKDDDPPKNSVGGMKKRKNLEMIGKLGLPLSIEPNIKKHNHSTISSVQNTFFNRQGSAQNEQTIERAAKRLKNLIDNNPELKADVEKNPEAIFDALKKTYEVNVSSPAESHPPLQVS